MKISYSALSTYQQCPLQYKYNYIDKLPKKESLNLYFGSAVHDALHFMLKDIVVPPMGKVLEFYHDNWKDNKEWEDIKKAPFFKQKGIQLISDFYRKFNPKIQEVLVTEDYFTAPLGDHQISGVIDRLDRLPDGTLEIVDYKTGKMKSQKYIHDNDQLTFYHYAIAHRFPDNPRIKLTLYFLEPQTRQSTFRTASHIRRLSDIIHSTAAEMDKTDFPARINPLCPWCDFKNICPAYRDAIKSGTFDELKKANRESGIANREFKKPPSRLDLSKKLEQNQLF